MGLEIKLGSSFTTGCGALVIQDQTGDYDDPDNLTGWGAPNAAKTDVDEVEVKVEDLTNDVTITETFTSWEDVFWVVPSGTIFEDGLYSLTITITLDGYEDQEVVLSNSALCQVTTCVDKYLAKMPKELCNQCEYTHYMTQCVLMISMLDSLCYAKWCGKTIEFNQLLDTLQKKCEKNIDITC